MSKTIIEQSLIEIEQNLKELESASSQVKKVTDKSDKLANSITALVTNIEAIKNTFNNDKEYLSKRLDESVTDFGKTLVKANKDIENKAIKSHLRHEKAIDDSIDRIQELQEHLNDVRKAVLEFDLQKGFDKVSGELNKVSSQTSVNLTSINTTQKKLKELTQNLDSFVEEYKKQSTINLAVNIIGFLILSVLIYLTK